jgi:hypothetical protein
VLIAYRTALKSSGAAIAGPLAALAAPIVAWRAEVRPEAFTYLGIAVYYATLSSWFEGRLTDRWLWLLPAAMLLWVNLHIGFVFGFLLLGFFGAKVLAAKRPSRKFVLAGSAAILAALANPSGVKGLLYPLTVLGNYGYPIAETQSLSTVRERGLWGWEYDFFVFLLVLTAALCLWRWFAQKPGMPARWPEFVLLAIAGGLSVVLARNLPVFCLVMIPTAAVLLQDLRERRPKPQSLTRYVAIAGVAAGLLAAAQIYQERSTTAGAGLKPGVNDAAEFLKSNGVTGRFFNDFDIGGYLTFHFFQPQDRDRAERVFVDGRPEAYPPGFFQNTYIPMLSNDAVWMQLDGKFRFNALVLSLQDGFPPLETFILARVRDPDWAPVYTDAYSLIFVRRTGKNAAVIDKFLIPRDRFR